MCQKFHAVGKKVGDIRPLNLVLNGNGEIKVITNYTWPHELSNYEKSFKSREKTFLSPEECQDLGIGKDKTTSKISTA